MEHDGVKIGTNDSVSESPSLQEESTEHKTEDNVLFKIKITTYYAQALKKKKNKNVVKTSSKF